MPQLASLGSRLAACLHEPGSDQVHDGEGLLPPTSSLPFVSNPQPAYRAFLSLTWGVFRMRSLTSPPRGPTAMGWWGRTVWERRRSCGASPTGRWRASRPGRTSPMLLIHSVYLYLSSFYFLFVFDVVNPCTGLAVAGFISYRKWMHSMEYVCLCVCKCVPVRFRGSCAQLCALCLCVLFSCCVFFCVPRWYVCTLL